MRISDSSVGYLEANMKAISPPLAEEQLEEVYSVQWNIASDMYWQFGDKKSALLTYLTEHGPREFPRFKKGLKQLKRILERLADGDEVPTTIELTTEKPSHLDSFLTEVASQVSVATVCLRQPGLRKFFAEGIGKHVLTALEKKHSCSIETLGERPLVVPDDEAQSSVVRPSLCIPDFNEILEDLQQQVSCETPYLPLGRLQNSRIFCEPERRGQYSNERSGASVETGREAAERRIRGSRGLRIRRFVSFRIGKTKTSVLHSMH